MWSTRTKDVGEDSKIGEALSLEPFVRVQLDNSSSLSLTRKPTTPAGAVLRIVAFLALSVLVFGVSDYLIGTGLRRLKTSTFGIYNKLVNGQLNAAILITGSSRALTHYDARVIQSSTGLSAFNIGINGSQTDMQVALFKTYLKHNAKPLLLVHNLDSFTFVTSHGGVYFPGQYLPYLDEEDLYQALRVVDTDIWKARRLPLYGYAVDDMNFTWLTGVRGLFGWNPPEDRDLGFQPRHTPWTGDFERLKQSNPDGVRFEIEPKGLQDLDELLALCKQEGIRVLLVYSPVYYEMQALEKNRAEIFGRFAEIANRHGATIWDYSRSPISFKKDYFYNSQHLNAEGAALFSADLAAKLAASPLIVR
jgi:hypothetical protein